MVLTGAGVSVPSGIPDFRTPGTGLWENVDPMEVAHIDAWRRDPGPLLELLWRPLRLARRKAAQRGAPGARRARAPRPDPGVITQNIDRLHRAAGTRAADRGARLDRVERLSGVRRQAARSTACSSSSRRATACLSALPASRRSSPTSSCSASCCPSARWPRPRAWPTRPICMVCVGSSLEVYPVAGSRR